jgi:hypothetical protein
MKKIVVVLSLVALAVVLTAVPASVAGAKTRGAERVPLYASSGAIVGSAIINTTADGALIVLVDIDSVPNLVDYDILVGIAEDPQSTNGIWLGVGHDVLNTNAQGDGNAELKMDIPAGWSAVDSIAVMLLIRPTFLDGGPPLYGAVAVNIPRK